MITFIAKVLLIGMVSLSTFFTNTDSVLPESISAQVDNSSINHDALRQVAQSVTVRVFANSVQSSGVLIYRNQQDYLVVTNRHALLPGEPYQIEPVDGGLYPAQVVYVNKEGNDIAVLQFQSLEEYPIAELSDSDRLTEHTSVISAGFPHNSDLLILSEGYISSLLVRPLRNGYQLGYTSETSAGMSGGPIFNSIGEIIGINGLSSYPILNNAYVFEDGSLPSESDVEQMRRSSWGIPVWSLRQSLSLNEVRSRDYE